MNWTDPLIWCGPVVGEYPGQVGGAQPSPAVVNMSAGGRVVNFDPASSNPIALTMNGGTLNVANPLTLQGSSSLTSFGTSIIDVTSTLANNGTLSINSGNAVNVNSGGTLVNGAGASITNVGGSVTVNASGLLNNKATATISNTLPNLSGGTILDDGAINTTINWTLNSGTLSGSGTISFVPVEPMILQAAGRESVAW